MGDRNTVQVLWHLYGTCMEFVWSLYGLPMEQHARNTLAPRWPPAGWRLTAAAPPEGITGQGTPEDRKFPPNKRPPGLSI